MDDMVKQGVMPVAQAVGTFAPRKWRRRGGGGVSIGLSARPQWVGGRATSHFTTDTVFFGPSFSFFRRTQKSLGWSFPRWDVSWVPKLQKPHASFSPARQTFNLLVMAYGSQLSLHVEHNTWNKMQLDGDIVCHQVWSCFFVWPTCASVVVYTHFGRTTPTPRRVPTKLRLALVFAHETAFSPVVQGARQLSGRGNAGEIEGVVQTIAAWQLLCRNVPELELRPFWLSAEFSATNPLFFALVKSKSRVYLFFGGCGRRRRMCWWLGRHGQCPGKSSSPSCISGCRHF